jgi:transketolase
VYGADEAFTIGGSKVVRSHDRDRLALVGAGITLHEALAAAEELSARGVPVRVVDLYGVKPIDRAALLEAALAAGGILVTVEDHYAEGGLGAAVAEALSDTDVVIHRLAVREIPHSGTPRQLLERCGIGRGAIVRAVDEILSEAAAA